MDSRQRLFMTAAGPWWRQGLHFRHRKLSPHHLSQRSNFDQCRHGRQALSSHIIARRQSGPTWGRRRLPWQEKVCEKSHAATDADGDKCSGSSRIYEMVLHQGKALEMRHSLLYSSSKIMDDAWRTQRSSVSMANQTSGLSAIVAAGDSLLGCRPLRPRGNLSSVLSVYRKYFYP